MQKLNPDKPLHHAMHVDVSVAREEAERRLAAALAAGGRIVDDSDAPAWWILADRPGNKVCIGSWPDRPEDASQSNGDPCHAGQGRLTERYAKRVTPRNGVPHRTPKQRPAAIDDAATRCRTLRVSFVDWRFGVTPRT
jgi:hypothetical protein